MKSAQKILLYVIVCLLLPMGCAVQKSGNDFLGSATDDTGQQKHVDTNVAPIDINASLLR